MTFAQAVAAVQQSVAQNPGPYILASGGMVAGGIAWSAKRVVNAFDRLVGKVDGFTVLQAAHETLDNTRFTQIALDAHGRHESLMGAITAHANQTQVVLADVEVRYARVLGKVEAVEAVLRMRKELREP